jgi:hypothetical protein
MTNIDKVTFYLTNSKVLPVKYAKKRFIKSTLGLQLMNTKSLLGFYIRFSSIELKTYHVSITIKDTLPSYLMKRIVNICTCIRPVFIQSEYRITLNVEEA